MRLILQHTVDVTDLRSTRDASDAEVRMEAGVLQRARRVQETNDTLRFLTEAIPQQVWTADPQGELVTLNRRVLEYFAANPEDIRLAPLPPPGRRRDVRHPAFVSAQRRSGALHFGADCERAPRDDRGAVDGGRDGVYRAAAAVGRPVVAGRVAGKLLRSSSTAEGWPSGRWRRS